MYSASFYLGTGLSGLGNFLIELFGWRSTYLLCGATFIGFGALSFLLLKEP